MQLLSFHILETLTLDGFQGFLLRQLVLLKHPEKIFLFLDLLDSLKPRLFCLLLLEPLVVGDVVANLVLLLLLLALLHRLELLVAHRQLLLDHLVVLQLLLTVHFIQGLHMLNLLFNVVLVFFDFALRADLFIGHLSVKLQFKQPLPLLCPLLCQLLLLVVQECIKLYNGIPLVILGLPGLTYLGENFEFVAYARGSCTGSCD